jgi:hypothetical protein
MNFGPVKFVDRRLWSVQAVKIKQNRPSISMDSRQTKQPARVKDAADIFEVP